MKIIKTGMFWIDTKDIPLDVINRIRTSYIYPHPHDDKKVFPTFIELPTRIGIPAGNLAKIDGILSLDGHSDQTVTEPVNQPISLTGLTLRPYQEESLSEALDYFNKGNTSFNLSGDPGSGKSVMVSAIIAKIGVKTLIIAHLSMLTTQLKQEIEQFTDADVKVLDADNLEMGDVNIATSQFISNRPELWYQIKKHIGLIVVDEAETIASETTLRILQRAHAKYRIAITATFTRSVDGRTAALTDMIGHKVITLVNEDLLKPTIIAVQCDEYFSKPRNKNLYKKALVNFFRTNSSITQKVVGITVASLKKGRQVLIASDLKEFQVEYSDELEDLGYKVGVMNGSTSKDRRNEILSLYNKGEVDVLVGFGVLNAGLSIPRISTIIRVSTPGNLEKLEQLIGRGRRDFDGKEGVWFIDLMFTGFSYANEKRRIFYNKMKRDKDWKYASTTWDKFENSLDKG